MDSIAIGISCVVGVALLVTLVIVASVAQRRRLERWRFEVGGWAKQNGWHADFAPQVDWPERLPGHNRRGMTMVLVGTVGGRRVAVGNYTYTTTSTSTSTDANGMTSTSTTTHNHHLVVTAVWVRTPVSMTLHQRGAFSKLGRRLFGDGETATGHAEFDRRFRIESRTPDAARALVGPALIHEYLTGRPPLWSLHGGVLLAHSTGQVKDPGTAPGLVAPLTRVADLLGR
jgi:hypothetical protein